MRFTSTLALVSGLMGAGTLAADAWPATTHSLSAVRSGPSANHVSLGTLPAGSPVAVIECSADGCQTQYGYVNASAPAPTGIGGAIQRQAAPVGREILAAGAMARAPGAAPPATQATMSGARTTIGTTNVRSGPGVEYPVVKTLPDFTKVEVVSCANSWCQTNEGYISLYLLSRGPVQQVLSPQAQPRLPGSQTRDSLNYTQANPGGVGYNAAASVPAYGTAGSAGSSTARTYGGAQGLASSTTGGNATTTANVNVRSGPGVRYELLGTLPAGSQVNVVGCSGNWCQTQYGYVSARHLTRHAGLAPNAGSAADRGSAGFATLGLVNGSLGGTAANTAVNAGVGGPSGAPTYGPGDRFNYRSTAGWGPGYWGPGLYGKNRPSDWGARPSYWGGRPTYWNMHPGYSNLALIEHRDGDGHWSRRGGGRLPEGSNFSSSIGPYGQGPFDAGPSYRGRPVLWRPGLY